ncbi:hypothetical protein Tco_0134899 [Tanacetum coccineum]
MMKARLLKSLGSKLTYLTSKHLYARHSMSSIIFLRLIWICLLMIFPGFKTYEEFKNDWIYEWNEDVPWVPEKPWSENEVPYEVTDKVKNEALMEKAKFDESRDPCSSYVNQEDFEFANHIESNANYNPYLDIS